MPASFWFAHPEFAPICSLFATFYFHSFLLHLSLSLHAYLPTSLYIYTLEAELFVVSFCGEEDLLLKQFLRDQEMDLCVLCKMKQNPRQNFKFFNKKKKRIKEKDFAQKPWRSYRFNDLPDFLKIYTVLGRSPFSSILGPTDELGVSLEYWKGYYEGLCSTQGGVSPLTLDCIVMSPLKTMERPLDPYPTTKFK